MTDETTAADTGSSEPQQPPAPEPPAVDVPANIETAKAMLANGASVDHVANWLPAQCPDHFKTAEEVLAALGVSG